MAKRPRFSRWRRLPGVYRSGDDKGGNSSDALERLTLYVSGKVFDRAAQQAEGLGFANVQDYCTHLVLDAVESERARAQVAQVEARRGPLEGLQEISDDPEYLAELRASVGARPAPKPEGPSSALRSLSAERHPREMEMEMEMEVAVPARTATGDDAALGHAALVVLRHAGQGDEDDPNAFLPSLRRGGPVPPTEVAELAQALHQLETEYRNAPTMGRRLSFALHRLAFESQILHTDAWPDAFDVWTVDMLRSVQEAVERILSGQDIRYYPSEGPEGPELPR